MTMWKSLKKAIRSKSASRNKVPELTPDVSIVDQQSEQLVPATSTEPNPREQLGLFLISDGLPKNDEVRTESFGVDIVAIHGLNGNPYRTWTDGETKTLWLRDLLPKDIPGARIFTYGYPSRLLCSKSDAKVSDYADHLLGHLESRRVASEHRPIIFIAHSLGGIVCKRALIVAKENPKRNSENLGDIARSFRHVLSGKLEIATIYETVERAPLGRLVVDKDSAIMAIEGENLIPRFVDHQQVCRFKGFSDPDYVVLSQTIRRVCKKACYDVSLKVSEKDVVRLFRDADVDDYLVNLPSPVDGTCQWLLSDSQYETWTASEESSLLWITGYPGSGKTILSAFVTKHLEGKRPSARQGPMVCSFFCVEEIANQNDANAILRSIIAQILVQRGHLVKYVENELGQSKDGRDLLRSYNRLWKVFSDLACDAELGPVNIVLDALDECEEKSRNRFLNSISDLIRKLKSINNQCVKFLITSRPWVALKNLFQDTSSQQLQLEDREKEIDADLRLVIGKRVESIARRTRATPDTITLLEQSLYGKADRTFLWAKFALQILDDELLLAPDDFLRILSELPRDLEATYARFLRKLQPRHVQLAVKLVHIIVGSFRPLSVDEVSWILAMDSVSQNGSMSLAAVEQYRPLANVKDAVNTALSSFVRISNGKIYLVHHTVKEFLCSTILKANDEKLTTHYYVQPERADVMLASACVSYLTLYDFSNDLFLAENASTIESSSISSNGQLTRDPGNGAPAVAVDLFDLGAIHFLQEPEETEVRTCGEIAQNYTLFDYAAMHWARHYARGGSLLSEPTKEVAVLLSSNQNQYQFANWFRYYWTNSGIDLPFPSDFDPLVIACYFGHFGPHKALISHAEVENSGSLATALYWAARNGEDALVVELLRTDVQPDSKTVDGQNPLNIAAQRGHINVVEHLSGDHRVDINVRGKGLRTPLSMAAGNGHSEIAKLLLAYDYVETDLGDMGDQTPLFWAIYSRRKTVVRLFTKDHRVNINHTDKHGRTAFSWAAQEGELDVVADLLRLPGIDVENADKFGRTPLSWAAEFGRTGVIGQLAKSKRLNISHSYKDNTGRNPYSWAALRGHDEAIKKLIKYKVFGIDEEDDSNWTPLFWALETTNDKVLSALIDSGLVDVNHRDHSGRTALYWTAGYGDMNKLRILLAVKGIDAQARDQDGSTPLAHARRLDQHSTARQLEEFLGLSFVSPTAQQETSS